MNALCTIRDVYRSIRKLEEYFQLKYDLCLNEGMMLCSLKNGKLSSTELSEALGLTPSNTSKIIKSVEDKKFIKRIMGKEDKRHMYFTLTKLGEAKLSYLQNEEKKMIDFLNEINHLTNIEDK